MLNGKSMMLFTQNKKKIKKKKFKKGDIELGFYKWKEKEN